MGIYNTIIFEPIFNALIFLYNVIPGQSMGLAIIALTIILRMAMYPLFSKQIKSQKAMQDIQDDLRKVKEQFKDDPKQLQMETMKLYKDKGINPLSSCLPLLIQLPIWAALYHSFNQGLSSSGFEHLYGFVTNPGTINTNFVFLNLATPSIPLAVVVGAVQYWQGKMLLAKRPQQTDVKEGSAEQIAQQMSQQMVYLLPVMMVVIGWSLPSGLVLYFFISTLISIAQQYILMRKHAAPEAKIVA